MFWKIRTCQEWQKKSSLIHNHLLFSFRIWSFGARVNRQYLATLYTTTLLWIPTANHTVRLNTSCPEPGAEPPPFITFIYWPFLFFIYNLIVHCSNLTTSLIKTWSFLYCFDHPSLLFCSFWHVSFCLCLKMLLSSPYLAPSVIPSPFRSSLVIEPLNTMNTWREGRDEMREKNI